MRSGLLAACIIGLAAVSLPLSRSEAQVATELQEGIRVRVVRNNGKAVVGLIAAQTPDSLSIRAKAGASPRSFAFGEISHVDVSRGKSRAQGALIKGALGLGIGVLAGGLIGAATYTESDGCQADANTWCLFDCLFVCSRGQAGAFGGILGGAAGLVIGTAYGIATGREQWQSVPARVP